MKEFPQEVQPANRTPQWGMGGGQIQLLGEEGGPVT